MLEDGKPVALGRAEETTNIKMEGFAIRDAILHAGEEGCEIHTDSEFWVNVLTKWAAGWEENDWEKKGGPIKNLELVQELWGLTQQYEVKFVYERGHVGTKYNELADRWANRARKGATI